MNKLFALVCGCVVALGANAYNIATFEDVLLDSNSAFTSSTTTDITSGDFIFSYYGTQYMWNGVTVANVTGNTYTTLDDQYNTCTGGGYNSSTYAIAYYSQYNATVDNQFPTIRCKDATFEPLYVYVTNTAYALTSMKNGDSFARKFDANDYLVIHFQGLDLNGEVKKTVDFYLAQDGNIVDSWQQVDLSSLGVVASIRVEMESTDISYGYYNTPTYFAMDNFKGVEVAPDAVENLNATQATVEAIYDVNGMCHSEMQPGINILRMSDGSVRKVIVK